MLEGKEYQKQLGEDGKHGEMYIDVDDKLNVKFAVEAKGEFLEGGVKAKSTNEITVGSAVLLRAIAKKANSPVVTAAIEGAIKLLEMEAAAPQAVAEVAAPEVEGVPV